jgi:hypothetical protein
MTGESHPLTALTDQGLEALLRRALGITLGVGLLASVLVGMASGWRNGAMLATGTILSAASILEWRRLVRLLEEGKERKRGGAVLAGVSFLFRLLLFAGIIYGSLKFLRGSVGALLAGLGLAVVAMVWEAVRLLRN